MNLPPVFHRRCLKYYSVILAAYLLLTIVCVANVHIQHDSQGDEIYKNIKQLLNADCEEFTGTELMFTYQNRPYTGVVMKNGSCDATVWMKSDSDQAFYFYCSVPISRHHTFRYWNDQPLFEKDIQANGKSYYEKKFLSVNNFIWGNYPQKEKQPLQDKDGYVLIY